jgi:hypothetical protein
MGGLDGGCIDGTGFSGVDSFAEQGLIHEILFTLILAVLVTVASLSLAGSFSINFI